MLVDCEQVFENVGSGASWNRAGLERVKATEKPLSWLKGVSRKPADEIQSVRLRGGLSWGRIVTITGLPSSSIRRICTWDLEEIVPTAFGEE